MSDLAPLALIVAVGEDGAIGEKGGLPWRLPEDLKRFKRLTWGHAVLMGRRTHQEIGKPLAGRRNIVVSRTLHDAPAGAELARSLPEALALARQTDPEPCVIGGAALYEEALPLATRVLLTEVSGRFPEADAFFPAWDRTAWIEVERAEGQGCRYLTLVRAPLKTP